MNCVYFMDTKFDVTWKYRTNLSFYPKKLIKDNSALFFYLVTTDGKPPSTLANNVS